MTPSSRRIGSSFIVASAASGKSAGSMPTFFLVHPAKLDRTTTVLSDLTSDGSHDGLAVVAGGPKVSSKASSTQQPTLCLSSPAPSASELNQVWTNIIDNAIDAMGGKGWQCVRPRDVFDHFLHAFGQRFHPVVFATEEVEQLLGELPDIGSIGFGNAHHLGDYQ